MHPLTAAVFPSLYLPPRGVAVDWQSAANGSQRCVMRITIDAPGLLDLVRLVRQTGGGMANFIRMQAVDGDLRMKVWFSLARPAADRVMDAVMRGLHSAEFGSITPA